MNKLSDRNKIVRDLKKSIEEGGRGIETIKKALTLIRKGETFLLPPCFDFSLDDKTRESIVSYFKEIGVGTPFRLPYPITMLEYDTGFRGKDLLERIIIIIEEVLPDKRLECVAICRANGHYKSLRVFIDIEKDGTKVKSDVRSENHETHLIRQIVTGGEGSDQVKDIVSAVVTFLFMINLPNIKQEKIIRPSSGFGKKDKRFKQNDHYHVLIVSKTEFVNSKGEGSGRTVREHLRRGHLRRYKSGKVIWVNSTTVSKNSEVGKVDKAYQLPKTGLYKEVTGE